MRVIDDESTSPVLLLKVADWEDRPAWLLFRDTYDPLMRRWCARFGLDAEAVDEVTQRVWMELAVRMRTFEYDPGGSFRGWLRRLCEHRTLNYLKERRARPLVSLDDRDDGLPGRGEPLDGDDDEAGPAQRLLLDEGAKIQAAVRARVKPHNWEAFCLVAVYDWSVERTAKNLGMTRAAVYAAEVRVGRMLRDEGRRSLGRQASGA